MRTLARERPRPRYSGDHLPTPLVSRGRLLADHADACRRASRFIGTRGMAGGGELELQASRGRIIQLLCGSWGSRRVLGKMRLVMLALKECERTELAKYLPEATNVAT